MPRDIRAGSALLSRLCDAWQLGPLTPIDAGMSEAAVFRSGEYFLKLAEDEAAAAALREEIARTHWLGAQRIRVPETVRVHDAGDNAAWLSWALPGITADASPLPPAELVPLLASGLRRLHALPVEACPFDETIRARLRIARCEIGAGHVDPAHFDDRNAGLSPEQIFARLTQREPAEHLVVAHGDATLSNMIVDGDGSVGFVDCGRAGRADRYLDLAICGQYIAEQFGDEWAAAFALAYGETAWQADKARYFLDLYELF